MQSLVFLILLRKITSGVYTKYEIRVNAQDLEDAKRYIGEHAAALKKVIHEKWPEFPLMHTLFTRTYRSNAENCWQIFADDDTVFMTTGDIRRMWLRDSTAQMQAYIPLLAASIRRNKGAIALSKVFQGVLRRQVRFLHSDIYGSAFYNRTGYGKSQGPNRDECPPSILCRDCRAKNSTPECGPYTFQKDFELDSPCAVVRLHVEYVKATNHTNIYDDEVKQILIKMLHLFEIEQKHYQNSEYYYKPIPFKSNDNTGLIWSFARPSDDQQVYGFNIPNNMVVVVALDDIALIATKYYHDDYLAQRAQNLAHQIRKALAHHGIINFLGKKQKIPLLPRQRLMSIRNRTAYRRYTSRYSRNRTYGIRRRKYTQIRKDKNSKRRHLLSLLSDIDQPPMLNEKIWAFEVDGFGKYVQMDDANLPNLLGIALSGFKLGNDIASSVGINETNLYISTRRFALSQANPNFFLNLNHDLAGLGSHHVTAIRTRPGKICPRNCIWTLGLIIQSMTARTVQERDNCLKLLYETTDSTYLMHEGFFFFLIPHDIIVILLAGRTP
mmetsp:Transcript_1541/g.2298  ORF Transcript_1541/g.2298 Transcript_1541/m.2298 type:complete len:553 (+) Transcript_1541:89-1747(+)